MPSWTDFQPFIVTGLSVGGVYALSGVGMVVLYRATGVLFLALGAVGAMGSLLAWQVINQAHWNQYLGFLVCIAFSGVLTLAYGMVFGASLSKRGTLVNATATLGLALILLGLMDLAWPASGGASRAIQLPTDGGGFMIGQVQVEWTNVVALAFGLVVTVVTGAFLRVSKLGTAMRAMANDREITATLGVPVRRVEAAAWLGCGILSGIGGLLLADLVALDATTLTFLVLYALAATLVAQLRSITLAFAAAIVVGLVEEVLTPIQSVTNYREMTPFVIAMIALLWQNRRSTIGLTREGI